jgi:DNA-binding HxlR family transcriptional regulator
LHHATQYQATQYHGTMRRKSFEDMNCSVAQTLEVVGEWWSMLIVRDCFLGITKFDDFHERLGISRNILTERLDHLVTRGVLARIPYQHHPVRYDYRLTDKGRDLWLVLTAMRQWGDRWEAADGPPVVIDHRACGHETTVVPACSACGEPLDARAVAVRPGPGSVRRPADALLRSASAG